MTRNRQSKTREKDREELYDFSDSDDAEWLHDGAEPAISTSESESLVDEGEAGDLILDDNDGLSELGEERSDASSGTDEEGPLRKKKKRDPFSKLFSKPFVNPGDGQFEFEVGQTFVDGTAFRAALRDYGVKGGYLFEKKKNDKTRITVVCAGPDCKWRIHASVLPDKKTFMVKTMNSEHTCIRTDCTDNTNASTAWIADKLNQMLNVDPTMSYELMHSEIKKNGALMFNSGSCIGQEPMAGRLQKVLMKTPLNSCSNIFII